MKVLVWNWDAADNLGGLQKKKCFYITYPHPVWIKLVQTDFYFPKCSLTITAFFYTLRDHHIHTRAIMDGDT